MEVLSSSFVRGPWSVVRGKETDFLCHGLRTTDHGLLGYSSVPATWGADSSSLTISSLRWARAYWAATPSAFLMARSPELPWQMMQTPSMPSSGAPPKAL